MKTAKEMIKSHKKQTLIMEGKEFQMWVYMFGKDELHILIETVMKERRAFKPDKWADDVIEEDKQFTSQLFKPEGSEE